MEKELIDLISRIETLEEKITKLQQALSEHSNSGVAHMFPVKVDIE